MIKQFRDEYRWLSNFWSATIEHEGITYPTVEHFYVAMKANPKDCIDQKNPDTDEFESVPIREVIAKLETPGKAKRWGREVIVVRSDWDEVKVDVMKYAIDQKYNHLELKQKLIETGDVEIIEGNTWGDVFWGVDLNTGEGKNTLGQLIMEKRTQLLNDR